MPNLQPHLIAEADAYVSHFIHANFPPEYLYHNIEHIHDVRGALALLLKEHPVDPLEAERLNLAVLFHDIGYAEGAEGHEVRSAAHARKWLLTKGYPEEGIQEIEKLILATQVSILPTNILEKLLCDADVSHIGSPAYWDRSGRLRQEMLHVQKVYLSEPEWVDFEIAFLTQHEFHTEAANNLFEKRKQKHIRLLKKQKLRLNPEMADLVEELGQVEKKKKKKKALNLQKSLRDNDLELKQLSLGRGVETMFRTAYRTHVNLSSIADNKANIMLSINAIIISIVVANLVPKFSSDPRLILPTGFLLAICLAALVLAVLATRPKVTQGRFTREDIEKKRANLLFFGNFFRMEIDDFHWGMMEMIKDSDFLYSSMTRDLYYLGVVLAKKYHYLRWCYSVFMYGLIVAVILFGITFTRPA